MLGFAFDIGNKKFKLIEKILNKNYLRPVKGLSEHAGICPDIRAVLFILNVIFFISLKIKFLTSLAEIVAFNLIG